MTLLQRITDVVNRAHALAGEDSLKAWNWMFTPMNKLQHWTPWTAMTRKGMINQVEDLIIMLEHGLFY